MIDIAASHCGKIGCSELAAAVGVSPWKTPYALWMEKTGRAEPEYIDGRLQVRLGNDLEDLVAQYYAAETGRKVRRPQSFFQREMLIGHVDRRIVGERRGLECKTSLSKWAKSWSDDADGIPEHYLVQVHGYLMLTGWDAFDVAVLRAGPEFRVYTIHPDPELHERLWDAARRFWDCVQSDTPPAPITINDCGLRWPQDDGLGIPADGETLARIADLRSIKDCIAREQAQAEALELEIKSRMADASALLDGFNRPVATWKTQTSTRIDSAALRREHPDLAAQFSKTTTSRVFRLRSDHE